jgi:hypothetical protein
MNGEQLVSTGTGSSKWTNTVTFGDNVPDWRKNLRDGIDATTTMDGSQIVARYTPGYSRYWRPKTSLTSPLIYLSEVSGSHQINMVPPTGDPSGIDSSKSNSQALGKFARRISEVNMAFNGGVFLGELTQTLQTIKNPAKGLRNLVDNWGTTARRIRGSRVYPLAFRKQKVAEALADSWLEVQFGWRPLLRDIDDGCRALAVINGGRSSSTQRITAHGKSEANVTHTLGGGGESLAVWSTETVAKDVCKVIFRGAMRVEAVDPRTMDPKLLGFNPENFLPTAWELIPYSFLIDYFTNIGDIINGWSHLLTRLAWCNRTEIKEKHIESSSWSNLKLVKDGSSVATGMSITPAKSVFVKRRVLRAKYTGTYVPSFQLEVPRIGSLKWLNIAALIASRNGDRSWSYGN